VVPGRFVVAGFGTVVARVVVARVVTRVVAIVVGALVVEPAIVVTVVDELLVEPPATVVVATVVDVDAPGIVPIVVVAVVGTVGIADGGHGRSYHDTGVGAAWSSGPQLAALGPVNWIIVDDRLSFARTANGHRPAQGLNQFTLKLMPFAPIGTDEMVWYQNPVFSSTTPTRVLESTNGLGVSVTG
jgi:hypothetical protein